MNKRRFTALFLSLLVLSAAMTGCITRRYTNDAGEKCQRKIKFFILFFKITSSCDPADGADSQQASIQTSPQS